MRNWLPKGLRRRLSRWVIRWTRWPPVGHVPARRLWSLSPVSRDWGFDRGLPVDRYYIEAFLNARREDVHGRVLEIDGDKYTRRYGGERVTRADVLSLEPRLGATLVGDLADGTGLPSEAFDCVILTQTLQLVYDVDAAVRTLHRILRPGGVALVTVPGISRMTGDEGGRWGYFWGFTTLSARRLFGTRFPGGLVDVSSSGNVLTAIAFLHGIASDELDPAALDRVDPDYEVVVTIRAVKGGEPTAGPVSQEGP